MRRTELIIKLKQPHPKQTEFIDSPAKRIVVRAGRRSGKTVGMAIKAVRAFLNGHRVLYAAPTSEQITRFWYEVTTALIEPINAKIFRKNEVEHFIERTGTEQRIKAKTAWNANTLRGDYADLLILDEYQLMNEEAWNTVGAPMLLDNDGDAVFIYTPPSLHSRSVSKADDPQHAAKFYKRAQQLDSKRWQTFHFTSHDNPYISQEALDEITQDMTSLAHRMEILAEDINEAPGALWTRETIEKYRVIKHPDLARVVVGVDPSATKGGDEAGIMTVGLDDDELYTLEDNSIQGSPLEWATEAVAAYHRHKADAIIAEVNNGGEMVELTIKNVDDSVNVKSVHATRGKAIRAEPIAAMYEQGRGHHVGNFAALEDELCLWTPGDKSPNRLDALVWAATELTQIKQKKFKYAAL